MRTLKLLPQDSAIAPVEPGVARPLWSVIIPTYNRTKYLESTLRSVLDQADAGGNPYGPDRMQIEVVDNASTQPGVEEMVRHVGSERVEFFEQPTNRGVVHNFNTGLRRARGHWIHVLHDDDMVLPGFYAAFDGLAQEHPEVGLGFCRTIAISPEGRWRHILQPPGPPEPKTGVWQDGLLLFVSENGNDYLRCPSVVVARRAYEECGGFSPAFSYSADMQMWMRVAARFEVGYVDEPLALYREHLASDSMTLIQKGDVFYDIERTIRMGLSLLPPEKRAQARKGADRMGTKLAALYQYHMANMGAHRAALRYARHLFHYDPTRYSARLLLGSLARSVWHTAREQLGRGSTAAKAWERWAPRG